MAFFRTVSFVRAAALSRATAYSCARRRCRTSANGRRCARRAALSSTPWEPTWPVDDLSRAAFRRRLERYAEDLARGPRLCVFPVPQERQRWSAGLTLANVRRGVAQAGSLGYWMGEPFARRGLMTAAVSALVPFAFGSLRLHRLEAACIPSNAASIRLAGEIRVSARRLCARVSLHQRPVAGPFAVWPGWTVRGTLIGLGAATSPGYKAGPG